MGTVPDDGGTHFFTVYTMGSLLPLKLTTKSYAVPTSVGSVPRFTAETQLGSHFSIFSKFATKVHTSSSGFGSTTVCFNSGIVQGEIPSPSSPADTPSAMQPALIARHQRSSNTGKDFSLLPLCTPLPPPILCTFGYAFASSGCCCCDDVVVYIRLFIFPLSLSLLSLSLLSLSLSLLSVSLVCVSL